MDNFTDKSSEVLKGSMERAGGMANSQGEFSPLSHKDLADTPQSTLSI